MNRPVTAQLWTAQLWTAKLWAASATLATPGLRLLLALRCRAGKELADRLPERRGIDPTVRPPGTLIWLHAASVGETLSILPVLAALAALRPDLPLLLTTGTLTSATLAAALLPGSAQHRFVPLDVPRWINRFLDHWRPAIACFVESEIWPNILAAAAARRIPLVLLNARLSATSAARWHRLPSLARHLFGGFALITARSTVDAERLRALGAGDIATWGDLKFAAPPLPAEPTALAALRASIGVRPVWIAASLHPGEDATILATHRRLVARHPGLLTILVPRHPARGPAIAASCPDLVRRSEGAAAPPGGLYLADTLGELGLFYRLANCAFVGGSLVDHGGQNPLEPARLGLPVAIGPFHANFAEAGAALRAAGALAEITDATSLAAWVDRMLSDPIACARAGEAGREAASRWVSLPDQTARALLTLAGEPA